VYSSKSTEEIENFFLSKSLEIQRMSSVEMFSTDVINTMAQARAVQIRSEYQKLRIVLEGG
jgi:hypothetical protein